MGWDKSFVGQEGGDPAPRCFLGMLSTGFGIGRSVPVVKNRFVSVAALRIKQLSPPQVGAKRPPEDLHAADNQ